MLLVVVTKRAAAQIERAAAWWEKNRLSAPGAVADDFEAAKDLLAFEPDIGSKCESMRSRTCAAGALVGFTTTSTKTFGPGSW